ncbi:5292_t:CDS:2, partial [Entrophospora sp. SA101]
NLKCSKDITILQSNNDNGNNNDNDFNKGENIIHRLISTNFIPVHQFYAIDSYYQTYHQIINNNDYFVNNHCDDTNDIATTVTATNITSSFGKKN